MISSQYLFHAIIIAFEIVIIAGILFVGISVVLTSMKTGISPMPSTGKACKAMLAATENSGKGPVADLGSGWGNLVVALARKYPDREIIGYELSLVPWLFSLIRKYMLRLNNLTLYRKDFLKADLSNVSVLLCYLFPGGMLSLEEKLRQDIKSEILIVSSTFALPSFNPTEVIRLNDIYSTPIYVYHQNAIPPLS